MVCKRGSRFVAKRDPFFEQMLFAFFSKTWPFFFQKHDSSFSKNVIVVFSKTWSNIRTNSKYLPDRLLNILPAEFWYMPFGQFVRVFHSKAPPTPFKNCVKFSFATGLGKSLEFVRILDHVFEKITITFLEKEESCFWKKKGHVFEKRRFAFLYFYGFCWGCLFICNRLAKCARSLPVPLIICIFVCISNWKNIVSTFYLDFIWNISFTKHFPRPDYYSYYSQVA